MNRIIKNGKAASCLCFTAGFKSFYILQNHIDLNHSLTKPCFLKGRKINHRKCTLQMAKKNITTRAGGGGKKLRYHLNSVRLPEKNYHCIVYL